MQIVQESENLYRLTRFGLVNCFLVRENGRGTLIDTNLGGSAGAILQIARELECPIHRILLTHAHFDHVASLDALIAQLPGVEVAIGARESRLLEGDYSLDEGEHGKRLLGFMSVTSKPTSRSSDGDRIGSFLAIASPGHTPGHFAYLDVRDNSLIAGDSFTTQNGLVVAGAFHWMFPFPALFSWNAELSARSAAKLRDLKPSRLCVGHGKTLLSPEAAMDRAIAEAFAQRPEAGGVC